MPRTRSKRTAKKFDLVAYNNAADKANKYLYTPVAYAHSGKSPAQRDEDTLTKTVRKLLDTVQMPELKKSARDGVRLFNYMYHATRAAERGAMPPFKGLELEPVTVTTTTKRGRRAMAVATLINDTIMSVLAAREMRSKGQGVVPETK